MEKNAPHNQEGQPPSRGTKATIGRLEEKEQGRGQANRDRIEAQKSKIEQLND